MRPVELAPELLQDLRRHADIVEVEEPRGLIEESHYDRLAVLYGEGRDTNVDVVSPRADLEAPVLREPLLRDVEPRHQLESEDQRRRYPYLVEVGLVEDAVDTLPDAEHLLVRLDVDIGGMDLHRVLEDHAEELHDRGLVLRALGLGGCAHVEVRGLVLLLELRGEGLDFLGLSVELPEGGEELRLPGDGELDFARHEKGRDRVHRVEVRRVAHHDGRAVGLGVDAEDSEPSCLHLGNELHRRLVDLHLREIVERNVQLLREELKELLLVDVAQIDERRAELDALPLLVLEGGHQLVVRYDSFLDEKVSEPFPKPWLYHYFFPPSTLSLLSAKSLTFGSSFLSLRTFL